MKRLEFKSILTRFTADAAADEKTSGLEERFQLVTDLKEAEKLVARAAKAPVLGIQLITATKAAAKAPGRWNSSPSPLTRAGRLSPERRPGRGFCRWREWPSARATRKFTAW